MGKRWGRRWDRLPKMEVEEGAEKTLGVAVSAEMLQLKGRLPALGDRRSRPRPAGHSP